MPLTKRQHLESILQHNFERFVTEKRNSQIGDKEKFESAKRQVKIYLELPGIDQVTLQGYFQGAYRKNKERLSLTDEEINVFFKEHPKLLAEESVAAQNTDRLTVVEDATAGGPLPEVTSSESNIPTPLGVFSTVSKQLPSGENPQEPEAISNTGALPGTETGAKIELPTIEASGAGPSTTQHDAVVDRESFRPSRELLDLEEDQGEKRKQLEDILQRNFRQFVSEELRRLPISRNGQVVENREPQMNDEEQVQYSEELNSINEESLLSFFNGVYLKRMSEKNVEEFVSNPSLTEKDINALLRKHPNLLTEESVANPQDPPVIPRTSASSGEKEESGIELQTLDPRHRETARTSASSDEGYLDMRKTLFEGDRPSGLDSPENEEIPSLFPEDEEEIVSDDAPLSPVKKNVVARLLKQKEENLFDETAGSSEIGPGGAEPITGSSEISPEEEALFKAVSNQLSKEDGSIDSRIDKKQITDLVKSLEVISGTDGNPFVVSKEVAGSSLRTPASNDQVVAELESAFNPSETHEFKDIEGSTREAQIALFEAINSEYSGGDKPTPEQIEAYVTSHTVVKDTEGNHKVVATSELVPADAPVSKVDFSSTDTVTAADGEAEFKPDDSASASLATHVRGLLICNKSTQQTLQKDDFNRTTKTLIDKGLEKIEEESPQTNSNFRELARYAAKARKESKHRLSGKTRSNLRACLDAYDKKQDTEIQRLFEKSKPSAGAHDSLAAADGNQPTEEQVKSLSDAIDTFNDQQAVKRHYARANGEDPQQYHDIWKETFIDDDNNLTDDGKDLHQRSADFEFFKNVSVEASASIVNAGVYTPEDDALKAQAQLRAIEQNGNALSEAIKVDLSKTNSRAGNWASEVQQESYEKIGSSIHENRNKGWLFNVRDLPSNGAGASPWLMDLRGLRGYRYTTAPDPDNEGNTKISVYSPTSKNLGFSTDYASYAKSLFNAQHSGGLYGEDVVVTIKDKDPNKVKKKIKALVAEAQKRGIPLSSISVNTPNLDGETQTLAQVVEKANSGTPPYGKSRFGLGTSLGKEWAKGVVSNQPERQTNINKEYYSQKSYLEGDQTARRARRDDILKGENFSEFNKWIHTGAEINYHTETNKLTSNIPKPETPFEKEIHKRRLKQAISYNTVSLKSAVTKLKEIDKEYLEKKAKLDMYEKAFQVVKSNPRDSVEDLKDSTFVQNKWDEMDAISRDALAIIHEDNPEEAAKLQSDMEIAKKAVPNNPNAEKKCFDKIKTSAEEALKKDRYKKMAPVTKSALQCYNELQVVNQAYDDVHKGKPAKQYTQLDAGRFIDEGNDELNENGNKLADSLVNPGIQQRASNTLKGRKARPIHQVTLERAAQQAQKSTDAAGVRGSEIAAEAKSAAPPNGPPAPPAPPAG